MTVKALMPVHTLNLVVPLPHEGTAMRRVETMPAAEVHQVGNSYFGLLRQASHSHADRAALANALRYRGHCVSGDLTKAYRRGDAR